MVENFLMRRDFFFSVKLLVENIPAKQPEFCLPRVLNVP